MTGCGVLLWGQDFLTFLVLPVSSGLTCNAYTMPALGQRTGQEKKKAGTSVLLSKLLVGVLCSHRLTLTCIYRVYGHSYMLLDLEGRKPAATADLYSAMVRQIVTSSHLLCFQDTI